VHDEHQQIELVFGVKEERAFGDASAFGDGVSGRGVETELGEQVARRLSDVVERLDLLLRARDGFARARCSSADSRRPLGRSLFAVAGH